MTTPLQRELDTHKTVTLEWVSAKIGVSLSYLQRLENHGFIKPEKHWGPRSQPVPLPVVGARGADRRKHPNYKGSQEERIDQVDKARKEGRVFEIPREVISSEERFSQFWSLPRGEARIKDPRFRREVDNVERGAPPDDTPPPVLIASPGVPDGEGGFDYIGGSLEAQLAAMGKIAVSPTELDEMIASKVTAIMLEEHGIDVEPDVVSEGNGEPEVEPEPEKPTKKVRKPRKKK